MNAPNNMRIWNVLSKTDPRHTKQFSRAGGFKGTAVKPIWITQRLTEMFGPCGAGWGIGEPRFDVVSCGDETMVYCTVRCWYDEGIETQKPIRDLYGVGGDKVSAKRQSGQFHDDEAFKKAFTDAVGNAFKFIGVAADVHMGLFDDSKYVREVAQEFADAANDEPPAQGGPAPRTKLDGPHSSKTALKNAIHTIRSKVEKAKDNDEIDGIMREACETVKQAAKDWPELLNGDPNIGEDIGLRGYVAQRREDVRHIIDASFGMFLESMRRNTTPRELATWMVTQESYVDELGDADRRVFERELADFEAGLQQAATVKAG